MDRIVQFELGVLVRGAVQPVVVDHEFAVDV